MSGIIDVPAPTLRVASVATDEVLSKTQGSTIAIQSGIIVADTVTAPDIDIGTATFHQVNLLDTTIMDGKKLYLNDSSNTKICSLQSKANGWGEQALDIVAPEVVDVSKYVHILDDGGLAIGAAANLGLGISGGVASLQSNVEPLHIESTGLRLQASNTQTDVIDAAGAGDVSVESSLAGGGTLTLKKGMTLTLKDTTGTQTSTITTGIDPVWSDHVLLISAPDGIKMDKYLNVPRDGISFGDTPALSISANGADEVELFAHDRFQISCNHATTPIYFDMRPTTNGVSLQGTESKHTFAVTFPMTVPVMESSFSQTHLGAIAVPNLTVVRHGFGYITDSILFETNGVVQSAYTGSGPYAVYIAGENLLAGEVVRIKHGAGNSAKVEKISNTTVGDPNYANAIGVIAKSVASAGQAYVWTAGATCLVRVLPIGGLTDINGYILRGANSVNDPGVGTNTPPGKVIASEPTGGIAIAAEEHAREIGHAVTSILTYSGVNKKLTGWPATYGTGYLVLAQLHFN